MRMKERTKQYSRKEAKTANDEDIENKQKETVHFCFIAVNTMGYCCMLKPMTWSKCMFVNINKCKTVFAVMENSSNDRII